MDQRPLTENDRLRLLGEILRHIGSTPGPLTHGAVFASALAYSGLPEERVGLDINAAIFLMVHTGVIESNSYDGHQMVFHSGTTLTASQRLTTYSFHETAGYITEGDDA